MRLVTLYPIQYRYSNTSCAFRVMHTENKKGRRGVLSKNRRTEYQARHSAGAYFPSSVGAPTAPVLPAAKHVQTIGPVGTVPAASAAPLDCGLSVSVPLPARAVVVTVIKPVPEAIVTEVIFGVPIGLTQLPAAAHVVAAPVRYPAPRPPLAAGVPFAALSATTTFASDASDSPSETRERIV